MTTRKFDSYTLWMKWAGGWKREATCLNLEEPGANPREVLSHWAAICFDKIETKILPEGKVPRGYKPIVDPKNGVDSLRVAAKGLARASSFSPDEVARGLGPKVPTPPKPAGDHGDVVDAEYDESIYGPGAAAYLARKQRERDRADHYYISHTDYKNSPWQALLKEALLCFLTPVIIPLAMVWSKIFKRKVKLFKVKIAK